MFVLPESESWKTDKYSANNEVDKKIFAGDYKQNLDQRLSDFWYNAYWIMGYFFMGTNMGTKYYFR